MQGTQFCGFVFCDPGRAVNVISLTTVTVTEEGGARNYFPLSKTLNLQEIDVNNLQCEVASNCKCPIFLVIPKRQIVAKLLVSQLKLKLLQFFSKKLKKCLGFEHLMHRQKRMSLFLKVADRRWPWVTHKVPKVWDFWTRTTYVPFRSLLKSNHHLPFRLFRSFQNRNYAE